MTFSELQKVLEDKFGAIKLADIARELDVTPQVVSNWKSRDQVPYKYTKFLRKKIDELDRTSSGADQPQMIIHSVGKESDVEEIDITEVIKMAYETIINNLKLIIIVPSIIVTVTIIQLLFFTMPVYTSIAKIIPSSVASKSSNQITGLASQFGLQIGSGKSDILSGQLYPEIIKSRSLARALLVRKFYTKKFGQDRQLIEILSGDDGKSKKDIDFEIKKSILAISKSISVIESKKSNLLTLSIDAFEPQLAADIASALIEELNIIQKNFKLSRIKEKRQFIENRLAEVGMDLVNAEEKLKSFREKNRNINQSPALTLTKERLFREVQMQMQIYTTLKSEFELAQIEEVENSDMVDILDPPEAPIVRTSPKRKVRVMVAGFLGLSLGLFIAFIKDWFQKSFNKA